MVGLSEAQLTANSGVRNCSWRVVATVNPTAFATPVVMGTTVPFVSVPIQQQIMAVPQTPVAHIEQPAPGAFSLRLRVEGEDQYGVFQRETSPVIPIEAKQHNYVYFSRVFSRVTYLAYSEVTPSAGATLELGYRGDPQKLVGTKDAHYAIRNHGWGIPMLMKPSPGWNVLVARHGFEAANVLSQLRGVSAVNASAGNQQWHFPAGSVEVGANVAGWPGTHDKIGVVDWSLVEAMTGGAPTYTAGDTVFFQFNVRSHL